MNAARTALIWPWLILQEARSGVDELTCPATWSAWGFCSLTLPPRPAAAFLDVSLPGLRFGATSPALRPPGTEWPWANPLEEPVDDPGTISQPLMCLRRVGTVASIRISDRPFTATKMNPRAVNGAGASTGLLPQLGSCDPGGVGVSGDGGCRPDWASTSLGIARRATATSHATHSGRPNLARLGGE